VGVDREGRKHVLGIACGATENAAAVKQLFIGLRDRGLPTDRKYLFVIDGAKALRTGIEEVFGGEQEVQRCRNHIAGRNPRFPEGWNVPSRASPYEPGSLGSDMVG
jgi:transposase-like protein